jgi:hypothetical protein
MGITTNFRRAIDEFFQLVTRGTVEIYNEFSFQQELGIHLRSLLPKEYKVQFERPTGFFPIKDRVYLKKEIDISVFQQGQRPRAAFELKFPRNGQYPEQMFEACRDLAFLEQLLAVGIGVGYFVMAVEDRLFCDGREASGIYAYFRGGKTIHGSIAKPTGRKDEIIPVSGYHRIVWNQGPGEMKHCVVEVQNPPQA